MERFVETSENLLERDLVASYFGELPHARRSGITNFRTANMVFSAAFNCSKSSNSGVSFFSFPLKDEKCCKEWLRLMKRKDFMPAAASELCSAHFSPKCF